MSRQVILVIYWFYLANGNLEGKKEMVLSREFVLPVFRIIDTFHDGNFEQITVKINLSCCYTETPHSVIISRN